jgi:biopolymer transport protein ExbD
MRTKRDEETPEVQMAPMIDCVFLLLIFFLITATIRKKHHELPIELPAATASVAKKPTDDCVIISIYCNNGNPKDIVYRMKTFLQTLTTTGGKQEDIRLNDLRLAIQGFNQDQMIRIDADHRVPYGKVTEVIDLLQRAGRMKFGLRTVDPER